MANDADGHWVCHVKRQCELPHPGKPLPREQLEQRVGQCRFRLLAWPSIPQQQHALPKSYPGLKRSRCNSAEMTASEMCQPQHDKTAGAYQLTESTVPVEDDQECP
mmetsp:Transcript_133952/g.232769  ORF Transcript_133952/g.232769 Transcript_133952/m.232769 type:complete len:106 (+) Transcript_133952:324-641(+)